MYQEFNGDTTRYWAFVNDSNRVLRILGPSNSDTDEFDNTTIKFNNIEQINLLIDTLSFLRDTYVSKKQAEIDNRQTTINFE